MVWRRWFARDGSEGAARRLYEAAVGQARRPEFYETLGVPDTLDGRFELVALHGFMLMRRLRPVPGGPALGQSLFDVMFADMDASLREMGAGDLGVGRRVKTMAKGFLGRMAAYDAGLAGTAPLDAALRRNLYGTSEPAPEALAAMTRYVGAMEKSLADQADSDLLAGRAGFPPPPVSGR